MSGLARCALCLLLALLLAGTLGEDAASDGDRLRVPEVGVAFGRQVSQEEWESKYDFVVRLDITRIIGNRTSLSRCSGTVWKGKVLTAAHCGRAAVSWLVRTATHTSGVSKVQVHPSYSYPGGPDFLLLTLEKPMQNKQAIALRSSSSPSGSELMLAGFGITSWGDNNPRWPRRPVVTGTMAVTRCPRFGRGPRCIGSGPSSRQSSCGADSGGPWLQWANGTAVVAGANSFGYGGGCGAARKMTGFWPTAAARAWLEQVAPGHFAWSP